jgi:sugar-specific transcriptional regulator TrmB
MILEKLKNIGLSKNQIEIYSLLILQGPKKGSEISRSINLSRQLSYKVLDELIKINLVEKKKDAGAVSIFLATHPSNLEKLLAEKKHKLEKAQKELSLTIDDLISQYNLTLGKPGVQFFEGIDGVKTVLKNTLSKKDEVIYTFLDFFSVDKYVKDINQKYMSERIKKGIRKKILVLDDPKIRKKLKNHKKDFTEIRLIPETEKISFSAALEIYDGKISYITFKEKNLTATEIYDPEIYKLNKTIFESL